MLLKLNKKDAEFIIRRTFPSYKGRTVKLNLVTDGSKHSMVSEWSGGSRSSFVLLDSGANQMVNSSQYANIHPIQQYSADPHWIANKNQILVEHVIFCGKDLGIRIHATVDCVMIPKNLLESKVE